MTSLVLREDSPYPNHCRICLRTHDFGGTSYRTIANIPFSVGHRIALGDSGIRWQYNVQIPEGTAPLNLKIDVRPYEAKGDQRWILLGDDTDGLFRISPIDTDLVREIQRGFTPIPLVNPDTAWAKYDHITKRLRAKDLRAKAKQMIEEAESLEKSCA